MKLPERIQRKRTKGWKQPESTCYCGRGSKWGNPYIVGKYLNSYGLAMLAIIMNKADDYNYSDYRKKYKELENKGKITLEESLYYYELWLDWQIKSYNLHLKELLKYDYLSCWCPLDQKCHVDILIEKLKEL